MNYKNFNEELKKKEALERQSKASENGEMALDDAQRVKVLSPGRLVFKRFIRNKLAIVGTAILVFMFVFAFLGPIFYPYGQSEIFWKYDDLNLDYATVSDRTEYMNIWADESFDQKTIDRNIRNNMNSFIADMEKTGADMKIVTDSNGINYTVRKLGDKVYTLSSDHEEIGILNDKTFFCDYNSISGAAYAEGFSEPFEGFEDAVKAAVSDGTLKFESEDGTNYSVEKGSTKVSFKVYVHGLSGNIDYSTDEQPGEGFLEAAVQAAESETKTFEFGGKKYELEEQKDASYIIYEARDSETIFVSTVYSFDALSGTADFSNELKFFAFMNLYTGEKFIVGTDEYSVSIVDDTPILKKNGSDFARATTFAVRTPDGSDTFDIAFKDTVKKAIEEMNELQLKTSSFTYGVPLRDSETGAYLLDENGNSVVGEREIDILRKNNDYSLQCVQMKKVIDRYAGPSSAHFLGTDTDGMDIFSRIMYGGRISLLVGFVVVIIETLLGVIMGGIAGYFGGWVDNIIMRLVDIFYCIPSMPILIILGALFDTLGMDPYVRLMWLMAVLGFLGWAGIARLVRGQILSLREQEFMVAAESTGLSTTRRIFKHLIPNVMPQLIVSATMGLGSVILTESTLSFLGLGVKRPLATWGTMINSVTESTESMTQYAYIWIPVGLLICLTVIAFNFVGDGLRDAFDPKMKR